MAQAETTTIPIILIPNEAVMEMADIENVLINIGMDLYDHIISLYIQAIDYNKIRMLWLACTAICLGLITVFMLYKRHNIKPSCISIFYGIVAINSFIVLYCGNEVLYLYYMLNVAPDLLALRTVLGK